MQQMNQPPQAPNFNGVAIVPLAGALNPADTDRSFMADRRLRELYVLNGPIAEPIAAIVADQATSLIFDALGMHDTIVDQTFIAVPSVLLDPNLRGTKVLGVVDKLVADSIELHHKFIDDLNQAAKGAANE